MRSFVVSGALLGLAAVLSGCGNDKPEPQPAPGLVNILQTAVNNNLSTLVAALTAGGLNSTLEGKGPFTVFAPSNAAFAKIPKADLDKLLANKTALDKVLTYHVLSGNLDANAVLAAAAETTLEGALLTITQTNGSVKVNDAKVVIPNVEASNGIVHVIDTVLMPPTSNIVQLAQATPSLSTLVQAVVAGGLAETLSGKGPFTVFAPTNEAFAKIPKADLDKLLANKTALDKVLKYHVVGGQESSSTLLADKTVKTLEGDSVTVVSEAGLVKVNNATVVKANIAADNGVVHLIDSVLMPPASTRTTVVV